MPQAVDTNRTRELIAAGAQLVEVLSAAQYEKEHIAGAVNIPLPSIDDAVGKLDHQRPVVAYCFDYQ
ncbi:MAG TPA: rhodanese-like domain-containing protein [Acidimicrobiales bacterium]|nr:rhodanese-like domain-containing protein [Acidimicrobiales bacterium]